MSETKTRFHRVILFISTDKPCTAAEAAHIVGDNIYGTFFPAACDTESGVGKFRVTSARRAPKKPAKK